MSHREPDGFLALPPSGAGRPVLVLHPWWGLNEAVRAFCRRLADAGFVAFAPDLYHGRLAATIPDAERLSGALDGDAATAEVAAAAAYLRAAAAGDDAGSGGGGGGGADGVASDDRAVGIVGFSMGAYFALVHAAADPGGVRAVVLYYGTGPDDAGASTAAFLGHFAADDPYEPAEYVDALEASLKAAGRPVTFHRYPGTGHWFAEPDRADAYDPAAAELAWGRTVAFLRGAPAPVKAG